MWNQCNKYNDKTKKDNVLYRNTTSNSYLDSQRDYESNTDNLSQRYVDRVMGGNNKGQNNIQQTGRVKSELMQTKENKSKNGNIGNNSARISLDPTNICASHPGHKFSASVMAKLKNKILNLINLKEFVFNY